MELEHKIMRNIVRISHNGRRKLHKQSEGKCVRPRGYGHILDLLSKNNGLTQIQIAQMLDIRPQSASEAVTSLEEQGLIVKLRNPQDKRSYLLHITPEGLNRYEQMQIELQQNASRILSALDEEEKNTLQYLLEKILTSLEENKEDA